MALTIDQLNIELTADSQKASSAIEQLASNLEHLKEVLGPLANTNINISNSFNTLTKSVKNTSNSTTGSQNAFSKLTETIKKQESHLAMLKAEYASYVLKNQEGSQSAQILSSRIAHLSADLETNKTKLNKAKIEADKLAQSNERLSKSANKTSTSFSGLAQKLAQKISTTRTLVSVFQNAANTMADWYNESNEYVETLNLFNVTMDEGADKAREFAESVSNLMGIDPKEWMQYQGIFKNLTSGFGVASDKANIMSQNLTQLSYDMASFFNPTEGVAESFDKLSSAMSGQVKGLREYGIDTTVATLQEYALSKGIDAKVRSMSQAEKSMLRYNYIMEQSRDLGIWNDMARTIVTPANALRILNAQLTQMKRAMGNVISVIVTQFIPYVQALVEIVRDAANAIANMLGFNLSDYEAKIPNLDQALGAEDAEDSLGGTSDKLKKIKKQLMGFDELNILSSPDSDSGASGGASGGGAGLNLEPIEYNFLEGLDTSEIDGLKEKMKEILAISGEIAAGFLLWKLSKSFLGSINALSVALGAVLVIDSIRCVLKDGLDIGDIVKGAIGGALIGAGLGFKFGGVPGAIGGAVIGIGITLSILGITSIVSEGATTENVLTTISGVLLTVLGVITVIKLFNSKVPAPTPEIETATKTITDTSTGTSTLTTKLKDLATNLAWGLVIIAEVAAAALLIVGTIWALGAALEQVGLAWQPVIDNGNTVKLAMGTGTSILLAVGTVTALLGSAGKQLAIDMGIGTLILAEIGAATLLFVAEIWAVGEGLNKVNEAWQPVLENGETIKVAIATGTALLIGVGVVTAALGAATVASAGALPLAIGLGTALLVELAIAFVALVESLVEVADQLTNELHPSLDRLNKVLPKLSTNMEDFTAYMKEFVGLFVEYSKDSAIAGFTATISKVIGFFTADPIDKMAKDVEKQYKQAQTLNAKLRLANPELKTAITLITTYYGFLEKIEELTGKSNNIKLSNGMFVSMKEVGKNLVLGFVDGMKAENSTLAKTIKTVLDGTFTSSLAQKTGKSFGRELANGVASGFRNASFPTLRGTVDVTNSGSVSLKLRAYAMGGLPEMGEMFIARERGPELVGSIGRKTAVANNDQIISGIESGVYRAVMAANSMKQGGGSQTIRIINEIDGDVVGEKVIEYHNNRVMQTGVSPLLV